MLESLGPSQSCSHNPINIKLIKALGNGLSQNLNYISYLKIEIEQGKATARNRV